MKLNSIFFGKEPPSQKRRIGKAEIETAIHTLKEYKKAKSSLETRIVEDEQWWKLRHTENGKSSDNKGESVSAWLLSIIILAFTGIQFWGSKKWVSYDQ